MTRRVPLNDLVRQNRLIHDELVASARRVIERGWYVLGSEGAEFEKAFAAYCGVAHAVGVANGTDAIELALRAVGVEQGHDVATVANAGFYASTSIHAIGARPLYVDVDPQTHSMSVDSLQRELARNDSAGCDRDASVRASCRHRDDHRHLQPLRDSRDRGLRAGPRRHPRWKGGRQFWRGRLLQFLSDEESRCARRWRSGDDAAMPR